MNQRGAKNNYNKNNGGYNKKPVKRTPISSKKFTKDFTDFFEGIEAIKDVSSAVYNLLTDYQTDEIASKAVEDMTRDDIMEIILNIAANHLPLPAARQNNLWEFTIASSRAMVKTDKFVSFGWQTRGVGENEVNTFTMIVFGEGQTQTDIISNLLEDGWEEAEPRK
jgi:hypothetical protein